jgi:RNA polymerase sigma-70 factor (ECF subfamily)
LNQRADSGKISRAHFLGNEHLSPEGILMSQSANLPERCLERFRGYLTILAKLHCDSRLRSKLDPSDIVQLTMLQAHEKQSQFRGQSEAEELAWLRAILANQLAETARKYGRQRRDIERERALDHSAERLAAWLAAPGSSPSQHAMRQEQLLAMADALMELTAEQREAIERHHLQGLSLAETASGMGKSREAVAGLLFRGVKRLRQRLANAGEK